MTEILQELMDQISMGNFDPNMTQIRFGIWDDAAVPYTFYAVITVDDMPFAGENSYGAETLERAVLDLYEDFFRQLAVMEAAQ